MARLLARLGCILMIFSFCALALLVVIPSVVTDNATLNGLLGGLLCTGNEAYSPQQNITTNRGGMTFNLSGFCVGADGTSRSVTDTQTLYGLVGFVGPLLIGILLLSVAVSRASKRAEATPVVVGVSPSSPSQANWPASVAQPQPKDERTFSEKLREIEEAHNKGLITREEYEAARKRIIDSSV